MTIPPILTRDRDHLRRLIDAAQSVCVWIDWGFESDGCYLPLDKPTVLRMLCGADGAFECHQNGVGVLYIARIPDDLTTQGKQHGSARLTRSSSPCWINGRRRLPMPNAGTAG